MKRKLDNNDEPSEDEAPSEAEAQPNVVAAAPKETSSKATDSAEPQSFADFHLDSRLLQAISKLKYVTPTLVQRQAIPLALNGRDVLAKAKTGSGKTAAYLLPIINAILRRKGQLSATTLAAGAVGGGGGGASHQYTAALILVPTRELADQVTKVIEQLIAFCARDVSVMKLAENVADAVQKSLLGQVPDIVVATPARAWKSSSGATGSGGGGGGGLVLEKITHLVLDEADLVLSYGYKDDLENVSRAMQKGVQTIMMSATLTDEIDSLKTIFCRDSVLLDLHEPDAEGEGVTQYVVKCGEDEKFLLAYVIFKLQLIKGKAIIFVSDTDRCYRLKLFFEQFGIRSCVLNSELPVNSRIHVVEEFNRGVYDYIVASDEGEMLGAEEDDESTPIATASDDTSKVDTSATTTTTTATSTKKQNPKHKKRRMAKDKEYGISRGIDFKNVAAVINFDLPTTSKSYSHRIGRTARAGRAGIALSFVIPKDQYRKHRPTSIRSAESDEKVLGKIERQQAKVGKEVKPYNFDMNQVEAFRYRMNDALRAVSKVAIREARTRELRLELVKSEKLKRHFEENPSELKHLRHDLELRTVRQQPHLKHVPDYMLPKEGKKALTATADDIGFVPLHKGDKRKKRDFTKRYGKGVKGRSRSSTTGGGGPGVKPRKKVDPLRTFKIRKKA